MIAGFVVIGVWVVGLLWFTWRDEDELEEELMGKVYAEGQGSFAVEPDPFDKEVGAHRSPVVGECAECGVEHHQDDLYTCEVCARELCEAHLDELEHECRPRAEEDADDAGDEDDLDEVEEE